MGACFQITAKPSLQLVKGRKSNLVRRFLNSDFSYLPFQCGNRATPIARPVWQTLLWVLPVRQATIKKGPRVAGLILFRKHDRKHAAGSHWVGGIGGAALECCIVVVYFPKELFSFKNEAAKVMFTMGVIVLREVLEGGNHPNCHRSHVGRQVVDARRQHYTPAFE